MERIRKANKLRSKGQALDFLIYEYEYFPPGYQGGYSQLLLEYPRHLEALGHDLDGGGMTLTQYIQGAFPNNFLLSHGVRNIVGLRQSFGDYAAHKLDPIDARFRKILRKRICLLEKETHIKTSSGDFRVHSIAPLLSNYVSSLASLWAPMDFSFPEIASEAVEDFGPQLSDVERTCIVRMASQQS